MSNLGLAAGARIMQDDFALLRASADYNPLDFFGKGNHGVCKGLSCSPNFEIIRTLISRDQKYDVGNTLINWEVVSHTLLSPTEKFLLIKKHGFISPEQLLAAAEMFLRMELAKERSPLVRGNVNIFPMESIELRISMSRISGNWNLAGCITNRKSEIYAQPGDKIFFPGSD